MKKNKPDFEGAKKQIDIFLPDRVKAKINTAVDNCRQKVTFGKNGCDNAFMYVN